MEGLEDKIEQAFWLFDDERKRTGAERDAFKRQMRSIAADEREITINYSYDMIWATRPSPVEGEEPEELGSARLEEPNAVAHFMANLLLKTGRTAKVEAD